MIVMRQPWNMEKLYDNCQKITFLLVLSLLVV